MPKESKPELEDIYVLSAALEGLELQKQRIEGYIRQVRSMLGGRQRKSFVLDGAFETALAGEKRRLSPEARKNISSAQKKRWAAYRESKKRASKSSR